MLGMGMDSEVKLVVPKVPTYFCRQTMLNISAKSNFWFGFLFIAYWLIDLNIPVCIVLHVTDLLNCNTILI